MLFTVVPHFMFTFCPVLDGQLIAADQHQNTIYVSEDGTIISAPGAAADLTDPQGAPEAQQLVLPDGQQGRNWGFCMTVHFVWRSRYNICEIYRYLRSYMN